MSADKYPGIFSRQMEAIVYIHVYKTRCVHCSSGLLISFDSTVALVFTTIVNKLVTLLYLQYFMGVTGHSHYGQPSNRVASSNHTESYNIISRFFDLLHRV